MPRDVVRVVSSSREQALADGLHCRAILAAGSRSFLAASRLLPARVRPAVTAFYAFCRVADDAIDLGDDPVAALAGLRRRVDAIHAGRPHDDPVDRAFAAVVEGCEIPRSLVDALLEGFAWDAERSRYARLDETLAYAARVASVVGVIMTLIMGVREPGALARACDLGAAMQLTNIARDVGEDARRGRLYLPAQWLREEGIDPDAFVRDPAASPGVRRVVARLLSEADRLYARAQAGIAALPADCRAAALAASSIYSEIGRVIARRDYDSIASRARTSTLRKLWLLLRAWRGARRVERTTRHEPPLPQVAFLVDAVRLHGGPPPPRRAVAGAGS